MNPEILTACDGDNIIAEILYQRGFDTVEKVRAFFLHDYIPVCTEDIKNIYGAVSRILSAITEKEKICVYGDYDVDGTTSTAILTECLTQLGADVFFHVPDRFTEGYGMNCEVIKAIAEKGTKLIVTCDCGISNVQEITLANELNMEVIVTDHHSIPERLPPALCLINPKMWEPEHPAYYVSGAVVAFYLARALFERMGRAGEEEQFLDLIALSIVADVVPLTSENKHLLIEGLRKLSNTVRPGLRRLMEIGKATDEIDEEFISFQIAPRINAAGRLDSARKSVNLLLAKDEEKANHIADELDSLNQARKKIEAEIVEKAELMIAEGHKDRNIFALYDEFWHHGVIGIAAGRLCEKYNKPVAFMTLKEDQETVVGSARSPEGVSIYDILKECNPQLLKFGGHESAAGLSLNVKDVDIFIKEVEKVAFRHNVEQEKKIAVDMELKLSQIDETLWNSLKKIAPFGENFERPIFVSKDVKLISNLPIKNIGRRLAFQSGADTCEGVLWRQADYEETPEKCEIIYNINQSVFRGKKEIKLNILSIEKREQTKEVEYKPEGIKITDLRGKPEKAREYFGARDTVIYYEGTDNELRLIGKNRFEISDANTLVMYSMPPSVEALRSIVNRAKPQQIVLLYIDEMNGKEEFIKKALGLIKFIISKKEGMTSYLELSILLGQEFKAIDLLLKYFNEAGMIWYEEFEDNIQLYEGNGKSQGERYKKAAYILIDEALAFRKFIRNSDLHSFCSFMCKR